MENYLGSTREEIERYYEHLGRLAEPRTQKGETMIRAFEKWRTLAEDEDGRNKWDKVINAFQAYYAVVKPLQDAITFRSQVILLNQPFSSVSDFYNGGHHPNLSLDEIYDNLLFVPEANRDLIFRSLNCSYVQQRDLSYLIKNHDKDGFIQALTTLNVIPDLSDICWELFGYEEMRIGREGLVDGMVSSIHLVPGYNEDGAEEDSPTMDEVDRQSYIQNEYLAKLLEASGKFYSDYRTYRQSFIDEDSFYPHTPREKAVIEDIINRPEGIIFNSLFEKEAKEAEANGEMSGIRIFERFFGVKLVPLSEGEKPSKRKRPDGKTPMIRTTKKWFLGGYSEQDLGAIIKVTIWPYLREELRKFNYGIDKEKAKESFNDAVKAAAAAIVVYCSECIGLSKESKSFTISMERNFSFLPAPRTTANLYFKRLKDWYVSIKDVRYSSKKDEAIRKTLARWKREDPTRFYFITSKTPKLKTLINNVSFLLATALQIPTSIQYLEPNESFNKALFKAKQYKDDRQIKTDGNKEKTAKRISDDDPEEVEK